MQAEYTCVKHSEYSICTKRRMQNEEERNGICDIKTEAREKCWQLTAVHAQLYGVVNSWIASSSSHSLSRAPGWGGATLHMPDFIPEQRELPYKWTVNYDKNATTTITRARRTQQAAVQAEAEEEEEAEEADHQVHKQLQLQQQQQQLQEQQQHRVQLQRPQL